VQCNAMNRVTREKALKEAILGVPRCQDLYGMSHAAHMSSLACHMPLCGTSHAARVIAIPSSSSSSSSDTIKGVELVPRSQLAGYVGNSGC
jgi:hypothetical protein